MFLCGNDSTGLFCRFNEYFFVKGLYSVDVDNSCINTLAGEDFRSLKRKVYHVTGTYKGNVFSVAEKNTLADLEFILGEVAYNGACESAESHVEGTVGLHRCLNCRARLNCVCGIDNGHAGDSSHKSKILKALVGRAILADSDSCVSCAYLDVKVRISYAVSHLLESSSCGEHCE